MPIASTPAQYILILIDMVEGQSCTRQQLLAGTTLAETGLSDIGARISDADFTQLVNNAQALTGDHALGLKLGLRLNLSAHAVLGQAFMNSRDLGQIMDLFLKYYHLLAPALHLEFEILDDQCVLTTVSSPEDTLAQFSYELMYAAIVNTLRGLLNRPGLRVRIEMPYPEPAHSALYYEIFGENVHFNCPSGRITFNRDLLSTPLPSSNPALRSLYEAECARLLADLQEEDSVAEQTLRLLRKLEGQYPQMPQLANMLNLSPRTYRRRLDEEKCSYQELLDQVRAEHATRYLQNTRLPLSSIAYMIGFNDASNFRRAYQKWTGQSPKQVRNGQRA
jgi:AraC-like DNA-binding protein